ncbi:sacsin N-terminal ATP-binding-like domain-containing protein [Streptomyces sp. NPDC004050]
MGMDDDALATAVRTLLHDPRARTEAVVSTTQEAARAVRLFHQGLQEGWGVFRLMAEGAQRGAKTLSSDPLQVLSEFVQNADDAGAGRLRLLWRRDALLIAHDGTGVGLGDVLLLGLPWISGKAADARSTGRFGIGLATLRALATEWEVHCHPFHVRFADLTLRPVEPPELPGEIAGPGWTVFRIPLEPGALAPDDLLDWFQDWSDASLLFLRHLRRIEVRARDRSLALGLSWQDAARLRTAVDGAELDVTVRHATAGGGEVWRVYTAQVPARPDWERSHKALGATVPVGVALPLQRTGGPKAEGRGSVHAGLPVVPLDVAARVHSQFDPVASREGFAGSRLNAQLVPLIADLWTAGVRDVLERVDPTAWHLVPLPRPAGAAASDRLQERIRAELLSSARHALACLLVLPVAEEGRVTAPLADLAVEEAALSGVLGEADIARLGGAPYALPGAVRDRGGRWRRVLADWRAAGEANVREEVRVTDALGLFADERQDVPLLLRLAAVALESGHELELGRRPCVVTADGRRMRPRANAYAFADPVGTVEAPDRDGTGDELDVAGVVGGAAGGGPLDVLEVVVDLHPVYREAGNPSAETVVAWLRRQSCLVRRGDTAAVLRLVSRLGHSGGCLPEADEATETVRLTALQRALGEQSKQVRESLGPGIGRAVRLNGFSYDREGIERPHRVEPRAAYLPQVLQSADGDRFAVAARKTPDLVWVHRSYARSLLSASEAGGLSRTAFLRLLGAADTPRLTPVHGSAVLHPHHTKTYAADARIGLARTNLWSASGRQSEMRRAYATHTLDDHVSGHLNAVIAHIAAEKDVEERRRRSTALLRTLAGPATSPEHARVSMAEGQRRWIVRGETAAAWLWHARETRWLEDSRGRLCPPAQLTLRTPDTAALYGAEDPGYLHPAIHEALGNRTDVLTALGVSGDPDVPRLAERLRELSERSGGCDGDGDGDGADDAAGDVTSSAGRAGGSAAVPDGLRAEALLVYRALARRLAGPAAGGADTSRAAVVKQIRYEFLGEELVLTDQGWRASAQCFRGPAILRGFRPFALPGADLEPLWRVLGLAEPQPDDLVDVLREIAAQSDTAPDADCQRTVLDALRRLRDLTSSPGDEPVPLGLRNKLRRLPLWTTAGWTRERSVFAVDDAGVERALEGRLPLWKPGGTVHQFGPLLRLLHVTRLEVADAEVADVPARATEDTAADATLTEDFRRAVAALQDLLVRDEPETADAFTGWAWLAGLDVRIRPDLRIRMHPGGGHEPVELPAQAHIDRDRGTLFLRCAEALRTRAGAGAAVTAHFSRARSRVGHGWRDVWEDGLAQADPAGTLTSAGRQDREELQRLAEELLRRAQHTPPAPGPGVRPPAQRGTGAASARTTSAGAAPGSTVPRPSTPPQTRTTPPGGPTPRNKPAPRPLVDAADLDRSPRKTVTTNTPPHATGGTLARTPGSASAGRRRPATPLPHPRLGHAPPNNQAAPADYAHHDKEELVLHALARILQEQGIELSDQRGVSGLGADAVDSTGRFYEIKAHGKEVPAECTLTRAEFVRAWSEGENYTLVIASHLAKGSGTPTLRLVNDPVHRFPVEPPTDVRLKDVRNQAVESTVYDWPTEE